MDLFQSMNAFICTVETGSMSAAAERLGISSAMVGQHIAALETKLQTRLLNRTTRKQSLTDFGKHYMEQCRDILERVAATEAAAEAQLHDVKGLLRITSPISFGTAILAPALKDFQTQSPLVEIDLMLTDQNIDIVEAGVDIAFRIGDVPDSRIVQRFLMPYTMQLAASPDYLAIHGIPTHPKELFSHNMMAFAKSQHKTFNFTRNNERANLGFKSSLTINSGQALVNAALAGMGIIIQPAVLLEQYIDAGKLIPILPDWKLNERQLSLLYYKHKIMAPKLRSFISFAENRFRYPCD